MGDTENLDILHEKREEQLLRHKISETYLELLRDKPVQDISITAITQAAGVSRMAFYRSFEDKDSMVDFFIGGIMHWEIAYNPETGEDYSIWDHRFGVRFFEAMYRHRDEIALLIDRGYAKVIMESLNRTVENAGGDMPVSSIERYDLYFLAGAAFNAMRVWMKNDYRESAEEIATALLSRFGIREENQL